MSGEWFVIGILTVLLIGQQVYWSRMLMHMTAKLMSRNYYEFAQVEKMMSAKPQPRLEQEPEYDPIAEAQVQKLNSALGIV